MTRTKFLQCLSVLTALLLFSTGALFPTVAMAQYFIELRGHGLGVSSAVFSPDGTKVVTASHDRTARIWDVASGRELLKLEGHTGELWHANFSSDGRRIATASHDGTARIWDADTGRTLQTMRGHTGVIHSATFSQDGIVEPQIKGMLRDNSILE